MRDGRVGPIGRGRCPAERAYDVVKAHEQSPGRRLSGPQARELQQARQVTAGEIKRNLERKMAVTGRPLPAEEAQALARAREVVGIGSNANGATRDAYASMPAALGKDQRELASPPGGPSSGPQGQTPAIPPEPPPFQFKRPRTPDVVHAQVKRLEAQHLAFKTERLRIEAENSAIDAKLKNPHITPAERVTLEKERSQLESRLEKTKTQNEFLIQQARSIVSVPVYQRGRVTWQGPRWSAPPALWQLADLGSQLSQRYVKGSLLPALYLASISGRSANNASRSGHVASTRTVELDPATMPTKVMHEITHGIENQNPVIFKQCLAFLIKRSKGAKAVRLSKLNSSAGKNYGLDEWAVEDDWEKLGGDAYTGKFYLDNHGNIRATEVLTMGIERLHADPIEFQKSDPEFFLFVITTLQQP